MRKTFKETWDYIRRNYLRKPTLIYIVFTLTTIILFFLNIFFSRYEDKHLFNSNEFITSFFGFIYFLGIIFNTAWFIITGIIIILKSVWDFDIVLMKILGVLFGIILIISSFPIVAVIYLISNIIQMD
jgi:hypothetical protein